MIFRRSKPPLSPAKAKSCMIVVILTVAELYITVEKGNLSKRGFTEARDNGRRISRKQKSKPDGE